MGQYMNSIDEVVEEIMGIHRSLPPRPEIDDVEAAISLIRNVDQEDQARLDAISRQKKGPEVPDELFAVLQDMQKNLVYFRSKEQKREALKLLDLENAYTVFDELVQRASSCVPSGSAGSQQPSATSSYSGTGSSLSGKVATSSTNLYFDKEPVKRSELFTRDDSYVKKAKGTLSDGFGGSFRSADVARPQIVDASLKPASASGQEGDKLSLIKLASLIEVSSKKGTRDLALRNKLMDQIEWLPDSIGKLSSLVTLDLSENRIVVLPSTIGGLSSLTKLDLHANRISEIPDIIGDLLSLVSINLSGNQLKSIPSTLVRLVRLEELNLSSNYLLSLPETIGSLVSLKILDVETNNIEEIPHAIGQCSSLKELRADYNRLKALPEAVGKITTLEVLSVRYNNIRTLPTTMSSLTNLKELNVSFNELEYVPESLCFATSLVKINISNNFADLRALPRSIGNLESLEELDMSNNQIRVLPESFRMLSRLRVLKVDGNPLEFPPNNIVAMGAQAVVQYMDDLVTKKDVKPQAIKKKNCFQICFFSNSNKRKRTGADYVRP